MKCGIDNGLAGDEHQVPARFNIIQAKPHRFAHQTTGPIAFHRIADALAGRKSKSAIRQIVGEGDQDDQTMLVASSLATDLLKAIFRPQTVTSAHEEMASIKRSGVCVRGDGGV